MAWKHIDDAKVRHLWAPEGTLDDTEYVTVTPDWYADNGTPMDGETGDDLVYVGTEIEVEDLPEGEKPPADRIIEAVKLAVEFGGIDGAHHKAWVIDQMVRVLAGKHYEQIVIDAKAGEDGPDTYNWDEGIAP